MGRLLLIGHEPALAGALQASHHLKAHTVETCAGPFEATRLLRRRAFDVVLTDPATGAAEDLALLNELSQVRPGIKTIVLAPALSSVTRCELLVWFVTISESGPAPKLRGETDTRWSEM